MIGWPHAVDRSIAVDARGNHLACAAELRCAHHHVVDALLGVEIRREERIGVRARVARILVAGRAPRIAEHHTRNRDRGQTGEHADLVAVWFGVEVAAEHGGKRPGPRRPYETADLGDLQLADRAVVVAPAQVCAEDLNWAARALDLGEDREPFLVLVVARVTCGAGEQAY